MHCAQLKLASSQGYFLPLGELSLAAHMQLQHIPAHARNAPPPGIRSRGSPVTDDGDSDNGDAAWMGQKYKKRQPRLHWVQKKVQFSAAVADGEGPVAAAVAGQEDSEGDAQFAGTASSSGAGVMAGQEDSEGGAQSPGTGSSSRAGVPDLDPSHDTCTASDAGTESVAPSIAGDSITESEARVCAECEPAVAAEYTSQRRQPELVLLGDWPRRESSWWNSEPEVGNFSLFCGNWGKTVALGSDAEKRLRRETLDRQILRCPAQVLVIAESTDEMKKLLESPPAPEATDANDAPQSRVEDRSTHEHFVFRSDEEEDCALLIACRKDVTTAMQMLYHEVHPDHPYTKDGRPHQAWSRMAVCKISFKQNVGHLGTDIRILGVHGNYNTMKIMWPTVWNQFWDRLAAKIRQHQIRFVAGDFNMSLTEVSKQLRSRGIDCDIAAWYPWQQAPIERGQETLHTQRLGFDSCGIWYIGGQVEIRMPWMLQHVDILAATEGECEHLDTYRCNNPPGQAWHSYRSAENNKHKPELKDLRQRLVDLLTLTTTEEALARIPKRDGAAYCPYLRLRQKQLNKDYWLVNGNVHNGAHFPLCIWTKNASARSKDRAIEGAQDRRAVKGRGKGSGKGQGCGPQSRMPTRGKGPQHESPQGGGTPQGREAAVAAAATYGKPMPKGQLAELPSAAGSPWPEAEAQVRGPPRSKGEDRHWVADRWTAVAENSPRQDGWATGQGWWSQGWRWSST